jgi:hypothetical protein
LVELRGFELMAIAANEALVASVLAATQSE